MPPVHDGEPMRDPQIAGHDDQIADGAAPRAGQEVPPDGERDADAERGIAVGKDFQFLAALRMRAVLPERHAGAGEKRSDREGIKGEKIDLHRGR